MSNPTTQPQSSEDDDVWVPDSPLELDTFPLPYWPETFAASVNTTWHPKMTGLRLSIIFTTIALGTAKAATTYHGDTIAPITIEWVTTIVVFLIFLVLGGFEAREHAWPKWFFRFDWMNLVWALCRVLSFRPPKYQSDEADTNLLFKPKKPPLTGYRLIVTLCVVGLGTLKAALSYQGKSTEPTTIEWVLGVVMTVALYYLGLYEASSTRVLPLLFEKDFTTHTIKTATFFLLLAVYSLGMLFSCGWAYLWGNGIREVWFGPPDENVPTTPVELWVSRLASALWTVMAAVMGVGSGVGGALVLNYWLVVVSAPTVTKVYHWLSFNIKMVFFADSEMQEDEEDTDLFNWITNHLPSTGYLEDPPQWLKVIYYIALGILAVAGYLLVHGAALVVTAGWTGLWGYGLYEVWKGVAETEWYMWGFVIFWSLGASAAVGIGSFGTIYILVAFFSPLTGSHIWWS